MSGKAKIVPLLGLVVGLTLGGCVIHEGDPGYSSGAHATPGGYGYRSYGPPPFPVYREPRRANKFEPEKHVLCNSRREVCYETKGGRLQPSVRETKQYFGKDAAKDLKKDLRRRDDD